MQRSNGGFGEGFSYTRRSGRETIQVAYVRFDPIVPIICGALHTAALCQDRTLTAMQQLSTS
jgi:hypothetical protein